MAVYAYTDLDFSTRYIADEDLTWRGTWASGTTYNPPVDAVTANGAMWLSVVVSTNVPPYAVMRSPLWSQLVFYKEGQPTTDIQKVELLATQALAQSNEALLLAISAQETATEALQTVSGTNVAQSAYDLASIGTIVGTNALNAAASAQSTANGAVVIGTNAFNLALEALETAWLGTVVDNSFTVGPTSTTTGTIVLDFNGSRFQTSALTGDSTFISANRRVGVQVSGRIDSNGASWNLYFHPSWLWLNAAPDIPLLLNTGQVAILSLTAFGPSEHDVIAVVASTQ